MIDLNQIDKLPKHRRDWLEVWGNEWQPRKIAPGTCERCVFGEGEHAEGCVRRQAIRDFVGRAFSECSNVTVIDEDGSVHHVTQ